MNLIFCRHGAQSITISKFIPSVAKLLSDPTATVRDTAFSTVVELYKHIGERLRMDLQRKNIVPAAKLPGLLARFDEVKAGGEMLRSATNFDCKFSQVYLLILPTNLYLQLLFLSSG